MGNFISKLKQIGLDVLKGLEIVGKEIVKFEGWEPALKLLIPQAPKILNAEGRIDLAFSDIQNVVNQVEAASAAAGGLTGPQKLLLATNQITALMNAAGVIDPKAFADAATVQAKIEVLVNAVVDIENAQKAG